MGLVPSRNMTKQTMEDQVQELLFCEADLPNPENLKVLSTLAIYQRH